jgi:metal-sulfur cluster biosynthetic enzyme
MMIGTHVKKRHEGLVLDTLFFSPRVDKDGVSLDKKQVLKALESVYDPEHPISVLDLKIVTSDDIKILPSGVRVEFSPTTPFCPMGGAIGVVIKYALEKELGAPVDVKVKPGTHVQEKALNETLSDPTKYEAARKRFEELGLMDQCIQS